MQAHRFDIKIKSLLQVHEIDEIIVNTNSEAAIEHVEEEYAGTKVTYHRREEYYASSQCSGSDFFKHLGEVMDADIFIYAPCTSPFVKPETVPACIKKFLEDKGEHDCVSTVSSVKEFLWLDGKAMNYDPLNAPNSQDLPDVVALNFGVTIVERADLIKNRIFIGKHPRLVVTSDIEAIDIDTPLDFYVAEQLYIKTQIEKKGLLEWHIFRPVLP